MSKVINDAHRENTTNPAEKLPSKEELERYKLALEAKELRARPLYELAKLVIAVIGATAFLVVFFLDRQATREQRRWERKVAVVHDCEKLIGKTLATLGGKRIDGIILSSSLQAVQRSLSELRNSIVKLPTTSTTPELQASAEHTAILLREAEYLVTREVDAFPKLSISSAQWIDGVELIEEWQSRRQQPSPDFQQLFGKDLAKRWSPIAEAAESALQKDYSIFDINDASGVEAATSFRQLSTAFQADLFKELHGD